jgi:pimeloyl-ACP methyl ester carboxylesterase
VHPIIPATVRRQRVFENLDAMFESYRRKAIFRRIDDRGLRAYIEALARPRPDGQVELAYSPEWEIRIYETGPINVWKQLRQLQPPLLIVRGGDTDTFFPGAARKVQRHLPRAVIHSVAGATHLVPMERPREAGEVIESFLEKVAASETAHRNISVG